MIGAGTLVNAGAVLAAGLIGFILKKGIRQRFQDIVTQAVGLAVIFIGIAGTLSEVLVYQNGEFTTRGSMMLILSLVVGAFVGEWINIEKFAEQFGQWLRHKARSDGDSSFIEGFVVTSLTICIGAMAVVGAINDGLTGDANMLYTKAILDFVIVIIFASTYGIGVVFSVVPLIVFQGSITVLARFIAPYLTGEVIDNLSLVGSVLIFCVGLNLVFQIKIKIANLLPALIFAAGYAWAMN